MRFIELIQERVYSFGSFLYQARQVTRNWIWPFGLISNPLLSAATQVMMIADELDEFNDWAGDISDKIDEGFSLSQIKSYFKTWIDYATIAWDWVKYSGRNVRDIVNGWWSVTRLSVLAWINEAVSGFQSMLNWTNSQLATLKSTMSVFTGRLSLLDAIASWWSNWRGNVLATIYTWWSSTMVDVESLINSAFTERERYWSGWQDMRDKVIEFFANPFDYLWSRFADWFLGPEG